MIAPWVAFSFHQVQFQSTIGFLKETLQHHSGEVISSSVTCHISPPLQARQAMASHRGCGSAVETIFFVSWLFCLTLAPLSMSLCLCFFSLLFALTLTFLSRLSPPQKKRVSSATCLLLIPYSKRVHACPVCMQRREYECTDRRCECSSAVCYAVLKSTDLVWHGVKHLMHGSKVRPCRQSWCNIVNQIVTD